MDRIESLAVLDDMFTRKQAYQLFTTACVAAGLFSGLILLAFGGHL